METNSEVRMDLLNGILNNFQSMRQNLAEAERQSF